MEFIKLTNTRKSHRGCITTINNEFEEMCNAGPPAHNEMHARLTLQCIKFITKQRGKIDHLDNLIKESKLKAEIHAVVVDYLQFKKTITATLDAMNDHMKSLY